MRGVWIEMLSPRPKRQKRESLPMRGVWIEITIADTSAVSMGVTPHAGSVD